MTKDLLATRTMHMGLYRINKQSLHSTNNQVKPTAAQVTLSTTSNQYELWHRILGHVSNKKLQYLNVLNGKDCQSYVCDVCPKAKQQRLCFSKSKISTKEAFEMIHVDL